MSSKTGGAQTVVVAGDVSMDWNIARREDAPSSGLVWNAKDYIRTYAQPGGAALLASLIQEVAEQVGPKEAPRFRVTGLEATPAAGPSDPDFNHSYAIWSLHKYDEDSPAHKDVRVWRVKSHLGIHESENIDSAVERRWRQVSEALPQSPLVVLDDADQGFRHRVDLWRQGLTFDEGGGAPWIILKMAHPIAEGELWKHLSDKYAGRLVVVFPVGDLRVRTAQISPALSWERTAQDLYWELMNNSKLRALSDCAYVVVSFGTAGAVLLSNRRLSAGPDGAPADSNCLLFFDPKTIEGTWGQNHPSGVIGYTSCLVASLAHQLMLSGDAADVSEAIKRGVTKGLQAIRTLHREGYGKHVKMSDREPPLKFPLEEIAQTLVEDRGAAPGGQQAAGGAEQAGDRKSADREGFATVGVKDPTVHLREEPGHKRSPEADRDWTILHNRDAGGNSDAGRKLYSLARNIVRRGAKTALKEVPIGEFGDLLTADRREIESYRSFASLVKEYSSQEKVERPLSVAVFGPPGSGKSFGISEVAKIVHRQVKKRAFNISQFSDPRELLGALHQVRDDVLTGLIPLVFWDEFDTSLGDRELGWLRYFLAPMQDGKFQDGQITYTIGRSIFVFAGGTSSSRKEFEQKLADERLRDAKGTDFVSRLRGFIDIMGPNRLSGFDDDTYLIRRAILLRSLFERKTPNLFRWSDKKGELRIPDRGVLRAFLNAPDYKHGARSMESIIDMSLLAGKSSFERSSLPTEEQLDLHVNGPSFLALVQQILPDEEPETAEDQEEDESTLHQLAEAVHEDFRANLSEADRGHEANVPFSRLRPSVKLNKYWKDNCEHVRDIRRKLLSGGYIIIPARNNESLFVLPQKDVEHISEMEHLRWMKQKLALKYEYGQVTVNREEGGGTNEFLRFWRRLSPDEKAQLFTPDELKRIDSGTLTDKQKGRTRQMIRAIPKLLSKVGYTIEKVQDEKQPLPPQEQQSLLSLRVGVVGPGTPDRFDGMGDHVDSALTWLERAFPQHRITFLSPLKEGATISFVRHALQSKPVQAEAVLVSTGDESEATPGAQEAHAEFQQMVTRADVITVPPDDAGREEAIDPASRYVINHSDVLVLLGAQPPTAASPGAAEARARDIPLVWIYENASQPAEGAVTSMKRRGGITFENF